jgi:hypothetical protein
VNVLNVFNDREKAIIIWFCILLIWVLSQKSVRDSIKEPIVTILKILFSAKIGIPLLLMGVYASLIVFLAYRINLWDVSLLKDTLLWFFGTACIMFGSTNKAGQDSRYFRDVILDTLKFGALLEFVINLYVFNIFVELALVPVVSLVAGMLVIADKSNEYATVKKILNGFLIIAGLAMLIFALVHVFGDFTHFATIENAKTFLLPLVLTFAFLPFMYCLTLWARYETLFTRIEILTRNKELASFIKWKLFSKCLLNLNKLNRVFEQCSVDLIAAKDKQEVTAIMQRFKNKPIARQGFDDLEAY